MSMEKPFKNIGALRNVLSKKGIENTNPHHALGDAMATEELFNTITREAVLKCSLTKYLPRGSTKHQSSLEKQ